MRRLVLLQLSIVTALLPMPVTPTGPEGNKSACNLEGQRSLDNGRFEEARIAFKSSREDALKSGDASSAATCAFYLGLTAQLEAKPHAEDAQTDRRRELLLQAITWYQSVLPFNDSPGVVENLGRAYSDLEDPDKVDRLFLEAISKAKGDAVADLRRSYADLLAERQSWRKAADQYRRVLREAPTDGATWDAFLGMLSKNVPADLPEAIWDAVDNNQTIVAQRYALSVLSNHAIDPEIRVSLLAAIVAALSRQHYPPALFEEGTLGKEMHRLEADPAVGKGASLVLAVHRGTRMDVNALGWWAKRDKPFQRSPLKAFRSLLRSLAARAEEKNVRSARSLLELADQLSKTPDLPLYVEIAAMYQAAGDPRALSESLKRWEPAVEGAKNKVGFEMLAQYHLAMSEAVNRLGIRSKPGKVDSREYQLAKASVAAKQSKNEEIIALVDEAEDLLKLPSGGGGGGGGGGFGRNRTPVIASLECAGGPGQCGRFEVEVPDLFQRPEDLRAGVTRSARVVRGCEPPHIIGWRLEHTSPEKSSSPSIRLARSARLSEPGLTLQGLRKVRPWDTPLGNESSSPQEVKLTPQPLWVNEGAWLGAKSFAMVDVLRNTLLRYGTDGQLLDATDHFTLQNGQKVQPKKVRSSGAGLLVLELGANRLVWLDPSGKPIREMDLLHRQGSEGRLEGILDWTIAGEDTVLAIGNILHPDGTWTSGLIRIPVASKGFETIKTWNAEAPSGTYYRLGQPYLATLGGKGYFLEIGETLSLYEVSVSAAACSLRRVGSVPGGITKSSQRDLTRFQAFSEAAALYQLIESLEVPAGLYAADGRLFLLRRPRSQSTGDVSWRFEEIDPERGELVRTVTLPTSAHHLTIIPGTNQWAVVQKGVVKSIGQQSIDSVFFVPSPAASQAAPRPSLRLIHDLPRRTSDSASRLARSAP